MHVVAAVVRVAGERLLLDAREVDHACRASSPPLTTALPTRERRIGDELRHRDDERGRALRLDVDLRARTACPSTTNGRIATTSRRPARRRRYRPPRRRRARRCPPPPSWYQRGLPPPPPKIAVDDALRRAPRSPGARPARAAARRRRRRGSRSPSRDPARSGSWSRTAPRSATISGHGPRLRRRRRELAGRAAAVAGCSPPPKAVRTSATTKTAARSDEEGEPAGPAGRARLSALDPPPPVGARVRMSGVRPASPPAGASQRRPCLRRLRDHP